MVGAYLFSSLHLVSIGQIVEFSIAALLCWVKILIFEKVSKKIIILSFFLFIYTCLKATLIALIAMKNLISDKQCLSCMDLFVLRHGKAGPSTDGSNDRKRALTGDGKNEMRKVGRWMRSKKFGFEVIATSPLTRAYETAEIVARSLGQKDQLAVWEELAPGGDLDTICYQAAQSGEDAAVLLTGHEPQLSMLISRIIAGNDTVSIILAKGGLAKIRNYSFDKRPSGDLQWLLTPKQMMEMQQGM